MAYAKKETKTEYTALNEDLKNRSFRPYYLLYGSEEYLKLFYKKAFRSAFGGEDGMAYSFYDGAPDVQELIDLLNTIPFSFGDNAGRLVIISGSGWFKKPVPDRLYSFLEDLKHYPDTAHLLFIEQEADKRSRLYKLVKKNGFACELAEQEPAQLGRWAGRYLKSAGKNIRKSTMELFLQKTGSSMDNIVSEMEKLIAYTGTRDIIEDSDVEAICSQNVEERVFDMISEMGLGHKARALQYYRDLLALQEAPMRILALMRRSFNQLLLTREAMNKEMSVQEGAAYVGVSGPWIYRKLTDQARQYSMRGIEDYIQRLYDYDEAIKSGNLTDRMAVELLLAT